MIIIVKAMAEQIKTLKPQDRILKLLPFPVLLYSMHGTESTTPLDVPFDE